MEGSQGGNRRQTDKAEPEQAQAFETAENGQISLQSSLGKLRRCRVVAQFDHGYAVALHFMYCNFVRIHQTLRVTPAMEAGLADHARTIQELVAMGDAVMPKPGKRGPYKKADPISN